MNGIKLYNGENIERALKRFNRTIENCGILAEVKMLKHYEKPSDKKRKRINAAKRQREIQEKLRLKYENKPQRQKRFKKDENFLDFNME